MTSEQLLTRLVKVEEVIPTGRELLKWIDTCPVPELTPYLRRLAASAFFNRFIRNA